MNYSAEDRHQRPRGVSAPYNIIKEQKDMVIGDIIPKDELPVKFIRLSVILVRDP